MNIKNVNVTYNNLVWKFNKNNNYPIQLYRDEQNTVLRTESGILFFNGYEYGANRMKIANTLASSTKKIIVPDTSKNAWENEEFGYCEPSTVIEPDLTFYIKNHDNDLYDIMLEIYELSIDKDGILSEPSPEIAEIIDVPLNYVGRDICDKLETEMCNLANARNVLRKRNLS